MNTSNYIFQIFDSHNTCTEQKLPIVNSVAVARETARRLSARYVKVIVNDPSKQWWEQYEKGEKVSWSA
jgi:hypothetical protein